ncbi:uncharacterized protein METZ01_LOCUS204794 [marine metagenome]|uniref:Uncharacterized protein n=1 Tax=marine metagenome TaxID=408172 RepID=A0A382EMK1_9ZZZZ
MVGAVICHDARPILVVTGDDGRVVATKDSVSLDRDIDVAARVIEACC